MEPNLTIGISFVAGLLSFLSPCVLPLIPAYLSLLGGASLAEMTATGAPRKTTILHTVFFIVGFSIVFIVLGLLFTSTFVLLGGISQTINIVAGVVVIVLGLNFIFDFWKMLNFEKRFRMERRPTNAVTSLLFGMAFGAGWSPCIGPILSSILFLAGSQGSLGRGLLLLVVYSAGLGLPFLLTGIFLPTALKGFARIKSHLGTIRIASGVFLVLIGVMIAVGRLQQFNVVLFSLAYRIEGWESEHPAAARVLFASIFYALALLVAVFAIRRRQKDRRTAIEPPVDGGSKPGVAARPVRWSFVVLFVIVGTLALVGAIDLSRALSVWFSYQGI
jgi:cytochrome c-type biogenesis protein